MFPKFLNTAIAAVVLLALAQTSEAAFARVCGNRLYDTTCESYKKSYKCDTVYMQNNCRQACDQCESGDVMPAKTTASCFDVYQSWYCTAWGDSIGCGTVNMVTNCKRSCNLCEPEKTKIIERIVEVTKAPVAETTTSASAVD